MRYSSEMARKTIHISSIALPIAIYLAPTDLTRRVLAVVTILVLAFDAIRLHEPRFRRAFYFLLGRVLREHERFNLLGSTYLLIAALVCVFAFPKPIAVTVLGFLIVGDAAAALIGRRWGRTKILDKSLEGSLACLACCLIVGFLYPGSAPGISRIVVGSVVATLFELLPVPLDDNLRIPLGAGFAMMLLP